MGLILVLRCLILDGKREIFNKYLVESNYLVRQVLNKPDMAGRIVSWSAKLS